MTEPEGEVVSEGVNLGQDEKFTVSHPSDEEEEDSGRNLSSSPSQAEGESSTPDSPKAQSRHALFRGYS